MTGLKPCPFCGEKDRLELLENIGGKLLGDGDELYFVECGGCWARGSFGPGKPNGVQGWNCRDDPARDALLTACKAMLEPFGSKDGTCVLCEWVNHADNCPVPIAEAAIALCEPPRTGEEGE